LPIPPHRGCRGRDHDGTPDHGGGGGHDGDVDEYSGVGVDSVCRDLVFPAAMIRKMPAVMVVKVVMAMVIAATVALNYRVEDPVLLPVIMATAGIAVHLLKEMGSRMWCWIDSRAAPVGG
jgi:hypothetical protein